MSDDGSEKNELQSVTEEEEGEDSSQVGSEAEVDKKKKKPLKSALKSKSKSKAPKKEKLKETLKVETEKPKGLNRISSAQTIRSVVTDLDNLSEEISRKFYKNQNYKNNFDSYQTPVFYNDHHSQTQTQMPMINNSNQYHRAQMREDHYRNNYRDYEPQYEHRRNVYENPNKFFSQSIQPQHFDNFGRSHMQREYLPAISQSNPREYLNYDNQTSHASHNKNFYQPSDYDYIPEYQNHHRFANTQDSFISVPQKLDIRSLYKNKPRHLLMEQDSDTRHGFTANSLIRPPQTTQNYRTKSLIPSASAIHIHRGI